MPSAATPPPALDDPGLNGLRVFISYPRGGATHSWAEQVHTDLATRGARVWRDEQHISEGDDDWYARIQQGLASAQVVACIVGADSQASRWQQREMLSADRLALPVVVLRTAPVPLPVYVIEKQPVELRDTAAPQACLARLAFALAQAAALPDVAQPLPGNAPVGLPAAQRQHELDYLNALLFGDLSDREARYEPLAGQERQGASLARSHKGLRTELTVLFQAFRQPELTLHDQAATPWADVLDAYRSLPGRRIRRLAVLGEPGAGKTFSLERIACHHARLALAGADAPLPLLVRLGQWTRETPLQAFIEGQLGALGPHFSALRDQGRAVLLLDGLNEIPPGQRQFKAAQLRQLAEDERFAAVVLSCRQRDYTSDYPLPFDTLTLQPLTPLQVHRFLQRAYSLDRGAEQGAALAEQRFWQIAGGEPLRQVWATWQQAGASFEQFWTADDIPRDSPVVLGKTSFEQDQLWRSAREDPRALMRLAGNPYLLFVLAALPVLPSNRAELFDGFLQLLYGREREAREARHEGRSVPAMATWLAALSELAEALQHLHPFDQRDELFGFVIGATTVLPRPALPASMSAAMWAFSIDASVLQLLGDDLRFSHHLLLEALASRLLLQASAQGAPPASRFWPPERWWQRNGWEVVAEFATEACAGDTPSLWRLLGWLAQAQPEVACDAWRRAGAPALPGELSKSIQRRWLHRLTDARAEPSPAARAAIGRALGNWGLDDRPGVGLRADGLPDIAWVCIPGDQPFVYHGLRLLLPGFEIARYPITHQQFQAFVDAGGYADPRWWAGLAEHIAQPIDAQWHEPNSPRETVSWYEAVAFCRWLSAQSQQDIRLPTELQWERAARGSNGAEYPWCDGYEAGRANFNDHSKGGSTKGSTTAVGIYPFPSLEGVHDLAGNVYEWCLNELDQPANAATSGDALRVLRGGAWSGSSRSLCAQGRYGSGPARRAFDVGFRVCRVSPIETPHSGALDAGPLAC